ncbi:zinc finger HIT domain-containing protein 2 [Tanacetum coccineum]
MVLGRCQKQFSQYTCPRCNTRYCSLPCYKSHSLRCTESFMRDNVMGEMQQLDLLFCYIAHLDLIACFKSPIVFRKNYAAVIFADRLVDSALSEETIQKIMSVNLGDISDLGARKNLGSKSRCYLGQISNIVQGPRFEISVIAVRYRSEIRDIAEINGQSVNATISYSTRLYLQ